jgi:ADP-heptose:LPS heptosyltransferase
MQIRNRNRFRLTRFLIFNLSRFYALRAKIRKSKKRILVIKVDAIGDYILFRNYLKTLKESKRFEAYEIDLLGHEKWKDLALHFDSEYISNFTFIDPDSLYEDPAAVYAISKALSKRRYEIVLQSTYSRSLMGNGLSGLASGKETVAYRSDNEHHPKYKRRTDRLYSKLIEPTKSLIHETQLNHYFFEQVIGETIPFIAPELEANVDNRSGILIFAGSSNPKKNWEKEKYVEIIQRILSQTTEDVILGGSESERSVADYILSNILSDRIVNKVGATSLPKFVELVASCRVVISNDTNAVHVAAACRVPSICVLGGGHFRRFLPYPEVFGARPISLYSEMPCYSCSWICKFKTEESEPYPCISEVTVDQVWSALSSLVPIIQQKNS